MISSKKIIFAFFIGIILPLSVFSQVSVEPSDDFYSDAIGWELKGYVKRLPQLRPFPVNVVYDVLKTVESCDDNIEAKKARYYLERYFSNSCTVSAGVDFKAKYTQVELTGNDAREKYADSHRISGETYVSGDFYKGLFGLSYNTGAIVFNDGNDYSSFYGKYMEPNRELEIKNAFLDFKNVDCVFDVNGVVTFGNENLYGSIGLNKTGFGRFPDSSLIMNPNGYQALNATINWQNGFFDYSQYFGMIGAWNRFSQNDFAAGKFLSFHSLRVPFLDDRFALSYFESVVYGKSFQPSYLLPVPYVIIANVAGYCENVLAGVQIDWKPENFFMLTASAVFDDMKIKKLLKLKLNDAAIRSAFTFGFVYTPVDSMCNLISFNYDLVTPYCYSYYDTSDGKYNYMDYTNCAVPMGLSLPPNSDRISLKMNFKPIPNVHLTTQTTFIRHANPYQSLEAEEVLSLYSNGSDGIYSDGTVKANVNGLDSALDVTDFLKQDTIMYVMQAAFNLDVDVFRKKNNSVILNFGYTFEYVRNDGVDSPMYSRSYSDVEEVTAARKEWEKRVSDLFNHYFAVSAKVFF